MGKRRLTKTKTVPTSRGDKNVEETHTSEKEVSVFKMWMKQAGLVIVNRKHKIPKKSLGVGKSSNNSWKKKYKKNTYNHGA